MTIRCLIVDDSPQFGKLAGQLLEDEGLEVLGLASSTEEAVRLARELRPDLALVDIVLGDESGLALTLQLCDLDGELAGAVILISTHAEDEFAELIDASPALGFIPKSKLSWHAIQELLNASSRG